jgi:hypothetical protein
MKTAVTETHIENTEKILNLRALRVLRETFDGMLSSCDFII